MRLKKYLDILMRIDPEDRIGKFVDNLTYLEARALKDTIYSIDASFADAIDDCLPRVEKLHIYSGIFQHYVYEIGDITIEVDMGNCLNTYEYANKFIGIKVSMTYYGLEEPVNITVKSCDKNANGYVDYHDWGEFANVFVETINRYIKTIKRGAPRFKYIFDKKSSYNIHSASRIDVKEDINSYMQSVSNNEGISDYIKSISTRSTLYQEKRATYKDSNIVTDPIQHSIDIDSYTIPADTTFNEEYDNPVEETYEEELEPVMFKIPEDIAKKLEATAMQEVEPAVITHEPTGLVTEIPKLEKTDEGYLLLSEDTVKEDTIKESTEEEVKESTPSILDKFLSESEDIEEDHKEETVKEEVKPEPVKSTIILNKNKKRRK